MTLEEVFEQAEKLQKEIMDLKVQLDTKTAEYKLFTKANIGLADGEPINVIEIAKTIRRLAKCD